jgi:hypothetical protein
MSAQPVAADAASVSDEKRESKTFGVPLNHSESHGNGTVTTIDGVDAATLHNHEVINKAIEAIGFGKFQWQLTFSCGFGFLVDQVRSIICSSSIIPTDTCV